MREPYIDLQNVNCHNQTFINLFKTQNNVFHPIKCLRCDEILVNHLFKANHDFLVCYGVGRSAFNEEKKPVHFVSIGEIQKYEIAFSQHIFILKKQSRPCSRRI